MRGQTPRRGVPRPLRAAFAVFHDLDGLRLCTPCDLFQPLTPMGLGSLFPARGPFTSVRRRTLPDTGGRWTSLGRLPDDTACPRLAPRTHRTTALDANDQSGSGSPIRSTRTATTTGPEFARRRLQDHRRMTVPSGLPRQTTAARTAMGCLRPRTRVSSPVCFDPKPRVTAALGRPTGNELDRRRTSPPCAPDPATSRPPNRSRLPALSDRFTHSTRRLRGRVVSSSERLPATRTRY
jgi:hypothetical protein